MVQSVIDTIMCHKSDMRKLWANFRKFCNLIDSSQARYDRILEYHPFINQRAGLPNNEYVSDYPKPLFPCEYIIHLLYYHIEICTFSQNRLQSLMKLRHMSSGQKKIYNVSKMKPLKNRKKPLHFPYNNPFSHKDF